MGERGFGETDSPNCNRKRSNRPTNVTKRIFCQLVKMQEVGYCVRQFGSISTDLSDGASRTFASNPFTYGFTSDTDVAK